MAADHWWTADHRLRTAALHVLDASGCDKCIDAEIFIFSDLTMPGNMFHFEPSDLDLELILTIPVPVNFVLNQHIGIN